MNHRFSLPWLGVGIVALALSGLFSIILAVAWHPSFKQVEVLATLFHRSLVAHVNLSITIWFLCGLFLCWSYGAPRSRLPYSRKGALLLMLLSIICMCVASLLPSSDAILSNYIPALTGQLFAVSLACIVAASLLAIAEFITADKMQLQPDFFTLGNCLSIVMLLVAFGCFIASGAAIPAHLTGETKFEVLFWGGGHVLQFIWVQVLLLCWGAALCRLNPNLTLGRAYKACLWLNMLTILTAPIPYMLHPVESVEFRHLFTFLMSWVSGLAPVCFVLVAGYDIVRGRMALPPYRHVIGASLWWSLILFALGGAFAVMINGINVKIPAHYHGSIVGVTLALMGFAYLVMEQQGYTSITRSKLALWQPALLGGGQIAHITGLFISGGYGVQRKSPMAGGEAQEAASWALRMMSTGGGIAIIGGLLFIVVLWRAWRDKSAYKSQL